MSPRLARAFISIVCCALAGATLAVAGAAPVSRDHAETFARKVALIVQHGSIPQDRPAGRRTTLTETEMNSWFTFRSRRLLPAGVTSPSVTLAGHGRLTGTATLDFEEIARRRGSGGPFDVLALIGGRVPLSVTGVLHTREGRGRFELHEASAAGVPVPKLVLQELVSFYTRSPQDPEGLGLERPFDLPLQIRQIELGPGQATVVQ